VESASARDAAQILVWSRDMTEVLINKIDYRDPVDTGTLPQQSTFRRRVHASQKSAVHSDKHVP
jgi:hypothetical protein